MFFELSQRVEALEKKLETLEVLSEQRDSATDSASYSSEDDEGDDFDSEEDSDSELSMEEGDSEPSGTSAIVQRAVDPGGERRELFGTTSVPTTSLTRRVLGAAEAEAEVQEEAKQQLLDELVDMAAALKGEATTISTQLQDQTKDLDKLKDIADANSSKLGGEVTRLHVHFRRRLVSVCGGICHMIAIVITFALVAVFMRIFPRRFSIIELATGSTENTEA